jgi:lipid II:glycine glycyltransferase (peptidoglycan interpeptide bridge formation enzyme)
MESIGWKVRRIAGVNVFIKHFPLIGSFIKIQRATTIPDISQIKTLINKERAFKVVIEPDVNCNVSELENHGFKLTSPYAPSKTIQIDLTPPLDAVFNGFTEAKQRAVRKAEKYGLVIKEGLVEDFIQLKARGFLFLQNSISNQIRKLHQAFSPNKAIVLLACLAGFPLNQSENFTKNRHSEFVLGSSLVAGILLLFYSHITYYWMAAATNEGKKLAAPSFLVWEALKLGKSRGCTIFDFEGVFDERFPKQTSSWKGFTKFKEGFGGKTIFFPAPLGKSFVPFLQYQ